MSRKCMLTGKKANNAYSISFSHRRNKRLQMANLQWKRLWDDQNNCFVRLKLSTKALKTLEHKSLQQLAKEAGLDLSKFRV